MSFSSPGVKEIFWAVAALELHIAIVVGIDMLEILFPSLGFKFRTDSTLGIMERP